MYVNCIFELTMVLPEKEFRDVFLCAFNEADYQEEAKYVETTFASEGVTVIYFNHRYKKKIMLTVNSGIMTGFKKTAPEKFGHRLDKWISSYFESEYCLGDFCLTRAVLVNDIQVGSNEKVGEYIRILRKIGKVKAFSPSDNKENDEDTDFCLDGNSNGIRFLIYDLNRLLADNCEGAAKVCDVSREYLDSVLSELPKGVLRAEVWLDSRKAIRKNVGDGGTVGQVENLMEKGCDVFMSVFSRIIPFGDFHKKAAAVEIIRNEVKKLPLRRKMMRLVELIPEKKSLLMAQKALNSRDTEEVMDAFAKINLSPVTISKRQGVNHLENLYSYMVDG